MKRILYIYFFSIFNIGTISGIHTKPKFEVALDKVFFQGEWYLQIDNKGLVDKECGFKFKGNQLEAQILFIAATDSTLFKNRKITCKKNICKVFLEKEEKVDLVFQIVSSDKIVLLKSSSNKIVDNETGKDMVQPELIKEGTIFRKYKDGSGGDFSLLEKK